MALAIRKVSPYKSRMISTFLMVFAMLVQPLVALNIPSAFATTVDEVIINEFDSASSSDWVELHNTTSGPIKLNGEKLQDSTGSNIANLNLTIPAGGYVEVSVSNKLNQDGDVIKLTYGQLSIAYGNAAGSVVGAPGVGKSAGLINGAWQILDTPTPGAVNQANVVAPSVTPAVDNAYFSLDNTGFSVGFTTHNFQEVNSVTVDLQKTDGTSIVKNTAKSPVFSLISGKASQEISTRFDIPTARADSANWDYGDRASWTAADEPNKAVITINGAEPVVLTNYTINESTPGATFSTLIPAVEEPIPAQKR